MFKEEISRLREEFENARKNSSFLIKQYIHFASPAIDFIEVILNKVSSLEERISKLEAESKNEKN